MIVLPLMGQKGEIIPLTKHIGFTLDAEENLYYEVFPDIPNFKNAQFFEINNNRIEARITFFDYTQIKVSRKAYNVKQLIRLQNQLNQKPMESGSTVHYSRIGMINFYCKHHLP